MIDLLSIAGEEFEKANIPYEFGEWRSEIQYPYFVGSYYESNYRYEDGRTEGTFTVSGWSRSSAMELIKIGKQIKELFQDLRYVRNGSAYWFGYSGSEIVPTGEENLFKIEITIYVKEWSE